MILSPPLDQPGGIIIVTPTKTGTKALEAELQRHGWEVAMPRHSSDLRGKRARGIVLLTVRNPFDRLVSMYAFGQHTKHSTLVRWGMGGFGQFIRNWTLARQERPALHKDWWRTYADYALEIEAQTGAMPETFRIEDGLLPILRRCEVQGGANRITNRSPEHLKKGALWTEARLQVARMYLADDLALLGYTGPSSD